MWCLNDQALQDFIQDARKRKAESLDAAVPFFKDISAMIVERR